jgi:uncharacterized membrane protein
LGTFGGVSPLRRISLAGLIALMVGSGVLHLVKPAPYVKIVPRVLGNAELIVFWSGVAEIVAGALLLLPGTRRFGARFTAVLLIAVFPANVQMALDGAVPGGGFFTGSDMMLWLRLPLQPLLVYWAWTFARDPGSVRPKVTASKPSS